MRRYRSFGKSIAVVIAAAILTACGRRDALVVYVSADEQVARPLIAEFERKTGIAVDPVFDTEATKTTGLAQRLRAERDRPRADVFWSSEIAFPIALAEEGILVPIASPTLAAWPEAHRDPENRWYAFAARARVIVFAPDRVAEGDRPATWQDLARERWAGRVAMADPRFGTTRTHFGAMKSAWDRRAMPGYFESWLEGLAENRATVLTSGNAGVVQAIVEGSADVGMTDSDDVIAFRRNGASVDWVLARHARDPNEPGSGPLLIPNVAGLVAGSAREQEARAFLEFLISPEAEAMLRDSASGNWPLGPGVDPPSRDGAAVLIGDALRVDWAAAARTADAAVEAALERIGPPGGPARDRP